MIEKMFLNNTFGNKKYETEKYLPKVKGHFSLYGEE